MKLVCQGLSITFEGAKVTIPIGHKLASCSLYMLDNKLLEQINFICIMNNKEMFVHIKNIILVHYL
jgi:hypothetical protein